MTSSSPAAISGDPGITADSSTLDSAALWQVGNPGQKRLGPGNLTSAGTLDIDAFSGEGGKNLNVGGTLASAGSVQVGSGFGNLSAATALTLAGPTNRADASVALFGSASHAATL
jgi:hypothetical protein